MSLQKYIKEVLLKELEMDKELITASLAQARADIEMQTKAR